MESMKRARGVVWRASRAWKRVEEPRNEPGGAAEGYEGPEEEFGRPVGGTGGPEDESGGA